MDQGRNHKMGTDRSCRKRQYQLTSSLVAHAMRGPRPDRTLEIGYAFWKSKVLLSAVEFDVFTVLAPGPLTLDQLVARLKLAERGARDFFDALVSLNLLVRQGDGNSSACYLIACTLAAHELYEPWGGLVTALRSGKPRNTRLACGYDALHPTGMHLMRF